MTEVTVQKTNPLPFTKCWWSKELTQKCTKVCRLGRNSYTKRSNPDEPAHKAYKAARNTYITMIKTAKKTHWEDFLQTVNDKTIWTAHRYASGAPTDSSKARVPTLTLGVQEDGPTTAAASNEDKINAFMATFFPKMV